MYLMNFKKIYYPSLFFKTSAIFISTLIFASNEKDHKSNLQINTII